MITKAIKCGKEIDISLIGTPGYKSLMKVTYLCDKCGKEQTIRIDTLLRTNSIKTQICEKCKINIKFPNKTSCKERTHKYRLKTEVEKSIKKFKGIKNKDYVECEICKKRSNRIDTRHLRNRHNLNKEGYLEKFPNALLYSENYIKVQKKNAKDNKANLGKKFSEEHKRKMSLARTNGVTWDDRSLKEYKDYRAKVRYFSEKSFREYYYDINPKNLKRGKGYHLDHIYPVIEGFKNNISPEVISHYSNLRIITAEENLSKGSKLQVIQ